MRQGLAVLMLVSAAACGSSASPFDGVWQFSSGNQTVTCGTDPVTMTPITGTEDITAGSQSNTISVVGNCSETFTLSSDGLTATATNQTCAVIVNGKAATFAVASDILTVNGNTLTEAASGSLSNNGRMCLVTQGSTASRIGKVQ